MSSDDTVDADVWLTIRGVAADALRQWTVTFVGHRRPVSACDSLHKRTIESSVSISSPVPTGTLYERGVGARRADRGAWRRPRSVVWLIRVSSGWRSVPRSTPAPDTGGTRPREGATHG